MSKRIIQKFSGAGGDVVVKRDSEWQEYIVQRVGDQGDGYHTGDRIDALETAQAIANGGSGDAPTPDDGIPAFHISVRSRRNGWQVVAVAHTEAEGRKLFAQWLVKTQRLRYVSLYKAEPHMENAWACIDHFSPAE